MHNLSLPQYDAAKQYVISPEGLQRNLNLLRDHKFPSKNYIWTDDFKT